MDFHDKLDEAFHDRADMVSATGINPRVYHVVVDARHAYADHNGPDRILLYMKNPEGVKPRYKHLLWVESEEEAVRFLVKILT